MLTIRTRSWTLARDERGFITTGSVIFLIAIVVVSSVFAFTILSSNLISRDGAGGAILAGMAGPRSNLLLRGPVMAEDIDVDGNVDKVYFNVAIAEGGQAVDLTPGRTTIRYVDASQAVMFDTPAKFSATPKDNADADYLLEPAEVFELALLNMETHLIAQLAKSTTFMFEVMTPKGPVFVVERTTPVSLGRYNDLDWGTSVGRPLGITIHPTTGLVTTEAGGTSSFTVVLDTEPTADVTIGLSSSDTTEGTVSPTSVTFTTANWHTAQTVTVTGVDDAIADGNIAYTIVTAAATSTDVNYNGLNATDVSVTNNDNETPGITISPTSGLVTTESGGTATFTVVLDTEPTADVTIGLSSSDTTEGTVSPTSVTFTTANWNTAQTVTVTGVDDSLNDGDIAYTIVTAAAVSADTSYSGLDPADVSLTNKNEDPTLYVTDQVDDVVYEYVSDGTFLGSSTLDSQNGRAKGITTDATDFWTTDKVEDKAYKYDSSFSLLTSWVLNASNATSEGITTDGTYIWVVDNVGNDVWYYTMAGSYQNGWLLTAGNTTPRGITTNGINIWVVNGGNDTVYKYDMYGNYGSTFALTAANEDAEGITTDGSNIWVVDVVDDLVYKYDMSGTFISSFSLTAANIDPSGITVSSRAGLASFQEGSSSYASTLDTRLRESVPSTPVPEDTVIVVDADAGVVEQALVRFGSIFGGGANQIPLGSTITSASLTVYVGDSTQSGAQIALHRMLVTWAESATWDSMTGGIQTNGTEAASTADATLPNPETTGSKTFSGLETTLQAWSDGATNYGWAILSDDGDGWIFDSSENGTQSQRPILRVAYKP